MRCRISIVFIGLLVASGFFLNDADAVFYDICKALSDEKASYDDFQALIEAIYNGQCSEAINVKTTFSMSKEDFRKLAMTYDIVDKDSNPLVFFRSGTPSPIGAGAILVYGNDGDFPVKMGDRLHIWTSGTPKDIIFEVDVEGCDPYDDDCDAACSYEDDYVCDPKCYLDNVRDDVQCDIDCVDHDGNHMVNDGDRDGICDPDCYNDDLDPKRAYDPDCVDFLNDLTGRDGICDPDSQGVRDGVCDPDCSLPNHICDFDCNDTVYPGNPYMLNDTDCYECDGVCNGFCSLDCTELDKDPDCPEGFVGWFDLAECCGNNKCGVGENCMGCTQDCPSDIVTIVPPSRISQNCSMFNLAPADNFFCCPDAPNTDINGCANLTVNKTEGEPCSCVPECGDNLTCTGTSGDRHCCGQGKMWNGSECKLEGEVLIVALKTNLLKVYSENQLTTLENKITEFRDTIAKFDNLGSSFYYLDDDMTAEVTPGGIKVTDASNWNDIDAVLDVLIPKLKSKYLIIIGGHKDFPQTPVGSTAGSDDPYGDTDGDGRYIPEIAIGRIPAPNTGDLDVMLNTFDTAINLHKAGGIALETHVSPIMGPTSMGCGGYDARDWNSGTCTCKDVWGDTPCDATCGTLMLSSTGGKDFVILLAHGPGPSVSDLLHGGNINAKPVDFEGGLDVSDALWMVMACGGAHLQLKSATSDSIAMTYLKNGGAVFIGSSDNNYGSMGGCPVPGGDCCIGSLYTEVAARYNVGTRVGDAHREGKNAYYDYPSTQGCSCGGGHDYQFHINYLLGDPTLKIKSRW